MSGPIRSPKTRSWDGVTLGDLARAIAAEHRLAPIVDPELAQIALGHIDQTAESDLALLTRLALHYDAIAKPAGDTLVIARRGAAKAATGQAMPMITLLPAQIVEWRYRHSARRPGGQGKSESGAQSPPISSGGVKAYYWDFAAGERREVTVGKPPYTEIRHVYPSREKALAAAQSGQKTGQRSQGELSLTLPGDARLAAETRLRVALRPGIPTDWIIARAEHRLSAQGYVTQLECQRHA